MPPTAHHQQELAAIRSLADELDTTTQKALQRIKEAQEELAGGERREPSPAGDDNGAPPLLAFVHIPKTAGGTVASMLTAAYSKELVRDAGNYVRGRERVREKISRSQGGRVSIGHVPYGAFREELPPDTRYMTFLREPIDRVLSHYYRHMHRKKQRSPKRTQHRLETPGKIRPNSIKTNSIEEALVELRPPQLNNFATRFLCGHPSPLEGDLSPSALDDAKANLGQFVFLGIQERFEESLVLLQRMLGLGSIPYRDRHVSSDRPAVDEIPDQQRALIEELNQLDAELYRFGLELFEKALPVADEGFAADVEALRAKSKSDREEAWLDARFAGDGSEDDRSRVADAIKKAEQASGAEASSTVTEPPLVFVHIPKTAGGTVGSMLTAAYSKDEIVKAGNYVRSPEKTERKVYRSLRKGGRVAIGHTPYGAFREEMPPHTRYMTFLREPVDRVLSHYFRHVHHPRGEAPPREQQEGWRLRANSIEQALVELRVPQLNNFATRFLCGHPSPLEELPASALDDAKENLGQFAFVGIQERFEESLVLLQRMLGLGSIPYRDRHVSSDRPAVDQIPGQERALIEEFNQLDAELYRFGLELFEKAVAAADEGFAADVEALRTQSESDREEAWREARFAGDESEDGVAEPQ